MAIPPRLGAPFHTLVGILRSRPEKATPTGSASIKREGESTILFGGWDFGIHTQGADTLRRAYAALDAPLYPGLWAFSLIRETLVAEVLGFNHSTGIFHRREPDRRAETSGAHLRKRLADGALSGYECTW